MSMLNVFCETCREMVSYTISSIQTATLLKGKEYVYQKKKAICDQCHSEVYVADIEDQNLTSLYDEYRQQNGIISLREIQEITEKYDIGKRPLSILLGWGEMTFTRYYDGDLPSKQYSDILKRVYSDPTYFHQILVTNKDKLKSEKTYEKSLKKVYEFINHEKSISKIEHVSDYLLFCCKDITHLALQKALYYVQGFFYAFYRKFLFDDDCEAWVHGPVYRDIYFKYASYRYDPIKNINPFDISLLSTEEKEVIDAVVRNLCCYSGKVLEAFTHAEMPWIEARNGLPAESQSNRIIDKKLIAEYFTNVKDTYQMLNPLDISNYAKKMFKEVDML